MNSRICIKWLGGVWDGASLDVDRHKTITMLGNVFRCPAQGAPFMILAEMPSGLGSIARYQADTEISAEGVLYFRPVPL